MSGNRTNVTRVSVFALVVVALTGLLVLFIQGEAVGAEPVSPDELAEVFATRTPLSEEECLEAAETVLVEDRHRRVRRLTGVVVESGWKLWNTSSPRRAVSQAGRLVREMRDFGDRDAAQQSAIQLLEPVVESGTRDPSVEALYQELLANELEARMEARLDAAEGALERGDLIFARVLIERSLEQDPDSPRGNLLQTELKQLVFERQFRADAVPSEIENWEAALAGAMLTGEYDRVLELPVETPDAELARAAARYLYGDQGTALSDFDDLSENKGPAGTVARDFLARPELNPELALELASDNYRKRKWLGRLGGNELSDAELSLSVRELKRWSRATSSASALGAPLRTWQGWTPDQSELVSASQRYLSALPEGEQADDAEKWLKQLEPARSLESPGWDDGRLQLPRARTEFSTLAPRSVVVTANVLESEWLSNGEDLRTSLGEAPALRLHPLKNAAADRLQEPGEGDTRTLVLSQSRARVLLGELAHALEQRGVQPHDSTLAQVLEALRALDSSLSGGYVVRVEPWDPAESGALGTLESIKQAALIGDAESRAGIAVEAGGDDIKAERSFGRASFRCPERAVCIDRERLVNGTLYSKFELDADFRVGARTGFNRASVALEVGPRGPQASLVLPLGDWLRVDRWIPVEARFSLGLDGMEFGPSFRKDDR